LPNPLGPKSFFSLYFNEFKKNNIEQEETEQEEEEEERRRQVIIEKEIKGSNNR
jgi:hypothetical protein